ncbi:MAG: fumarylacetoacetate hydrolase family protein, partial [Candidatus Hinthialibacter sp.]
MKRIVFGMLLSFCLPLLGAWSEEVFCRYQAGGEIYYGQVYGDLIHQLSGAPWNGGVDTGHTILIKQVKLLHPSEPQKIFGLSGAYKENWTNGKTPFNTIRWFLKPPSAAASPDEDVILPASVDTLLVETELVIVIGKRVKDASVEEAKKAIFGYTVGNDIVGDVTSYHRIQGEPLDQEETLLSPGLKMGDGFAPYGPFIYRGVDWKNRLRTLT